MNQIRIQGARAHNLRDVSLSIPVGKLTVVTGVSGSGKSSLAFDTVFAEAQRRFLESLPPAARSLLDRLERPDVDLVEGLSPAVSIAQFSAPAGPRATMATVADIHDHLRLLFAHLGQPHCPLCGREVSAISPGALTERLLSEPEGTKITVLLPMLRRGESHGDAGAACLLEAEKAGFVRLRVDGEILPIEDVDAARVSSAAEIDAVVDRLVVREGARTRMADSVELAMSRSGGEVRLLIRRPGETEDAFRTESSRLCCPDCGIAFAKLRPASFSFNSVAGACPACHGLGETDSGAVCRRCHGTRYAPEILACRMPDGANIADILALPVSDLRTRLASYGKFLSTAHRKVAGNILKALDERLSFLEDAGLGYLQGDRRASTLSSGELRRVRLASALGQRLGGVLYVLDEPTSGLHPDDTDRLVGLLRRLRDAGNTLLVVEHNEAVIRAADHLVELGPGAGREGGRVVFEGSLKELLRAPASVTAPYLRKTSDAAEFRPSPRPGMESLTVRGASIHNLRKISATFPIGALTVVTGVSGSGKSSLVDDVLGANLERFLAAPRAKRGLFRFADCDRIDGADAIDKIISVGRAVHSRSPHSTVLSATGLAEAVRDLFAATPLAKARGYAPSRFSPNVKGGRCEACRGEGAVRYEMSFLPDVSVPCEACGGRRFNRETLDVHFAGRSIADVFDLSIASALEVFSAFPKIARVLAVLLEVGLGYLTLGQELGTLSGGEAQRLLLATELARPGKGRTLYLLDEPSAGQHFVDIERLLSLLGRLRDAGGTIVVVEHNPLLMRAADWIIDLGPGGGAAGGCVVTQGTPQEVSLATGSRTAPYLR